MSWFSLSLCDVGRGVEGRFVFLKGVSGFTTKSLISSLFEHVISPNKDINDL